MVFWLFSIVIAGVLNFSDRPPYATRQVAGWELRIQRKLLVDHPQQTDEAVRLLEQQLREVQQVCPPNAVKKMKTVKLWFSLPYAGSGPRAEYHPSAGWLKDNGRDPEMARGIEFTNIAIFAEELRRMPNFALHELAHAYHDQVLGFENPEIERVYQAAKSKGIYDRIARKDAAGNRFEERAYAMTNAKEYFAELSEAYFATNDFFPFNQQELREHDPEAFNVLKQLWAE